MNDPNRRDRASATATACVASVLAFVVSMSANVAIAVPSTQVLLTGTAITTPAVYGPAELQALPAVTQTVDYTAAGVPQTHTYVGTSLWGLIGSAGVVNGPAINTDVLNKVVLATGTDGYEVVFSLGELSPSFGNRPDLVAYQEVVNGVASPIGADGFARVTAAGDIRGGRYVSNLASLDVRSSGSTLPATGGGATSRFTVSGDVVASKSFDLAALQALPTVTRVANGITYTGVSFWDLLNSAVGIVVSPSINNDLLGKYVVATGSDGYKSVFSLGELSPNFGNQPDLIAYAADGSLLTGNGFARLIVPNDVLRGRWVSNLVGLEVLVAAAVPEPGSYALMLAGLVVVTANARRHRHPFEPSNRRTAQGDLA